METVCKKFLRITLKYSVYLWVFLLPWQTKIILRSAPTNFTTISLYLSQLLLLVILIAFFSYQLWRRPADEPISGVWWFLAGWEFFMLLSFFVAPDQLLAFYYYILLMEGVGLFYLLREGLAFYGYEEAILDRWQLIYSLLASLFFQAVLGIYQFLSQSTIVCKYLGLAAHDPSVAGTAVVETASGRWLRAYGGLDHPNILGGVLAIALLLTAYLLAKKKMIRSSREAGESLLLFIFYFVALFALFFTFSRAAWLALAGGLIYLAIILIRSRDRWVIGRFGALLFFSVVMIFIVAYPYRELVMVRASDDTRLEQKSLSERQLYLGQAASVISRNWLLGVGLGNYTTALERQDRRPQPVWNYQPVHNVFLLLWSESGIFSVLCFLGFLWLLKKNSRWELTGPILVVLLLLMLCDHWLLSLPFGLLLFFWLAGLM
jgi:uncharacterized membrane protein